MSFSNTFKTDVLEIDCPLDYESTNVTVKYQMEQTLGMESPVGIPTQISCIKANRLGCTIDNCPAWDSFG